MNDVTPILEILMDCQTDAERADWLLRAPKGILFRDYCTIRRILAAAQFARGVDALDVEFAAINATRMAGRLSSMRRNGFTSPRLMQTPRISPPLSRQHLPVSCPPFARAAPMIQFKPNPLENRVSADMNTPSGNDARNDAKSEISQSGLVKLQRIADRQAGHKRWLGMAGRRITAVYPEHARWICLRVMTGREKAVEAALEALDIEAMVPTRKGPEYRRRGRVIPPADIPVLIGYTLVRCVPSATAMAGLNTIEHVIGVLGGWEAPAAINAEFIKRYRQKAADGGYDYDRPGIAVRKGQKVTIAEGPFGGIEGTVVTAPSGTIGDAVVEFSMMGRTVAMVVPLAILESL